MDELRQVLTEHLGETLIRIVISGARNKEGAVRIKIRPILQRDRLLYQAAQQRGKQEFHKNYEKEALIEEILFWMSKEFRQLQMETTGKTLSVLVSKKGKVTIKQKIRRDQIAQGDLSHNRKKRYILEEGVPVPFLVDLGVMTEEGRVVKSRYDKFRQINRFLEFIEDVLPQMERGREWTILDFGCGKSYLTFAMYYYLKILQGFDIRIIGLDLKEEVIARCQSLAERYGYETLTFLTGDIASYEGASRIDMVVTLHACDTATDYALEKAVTWGAKVILSVPCCQHELNGQLDSPPLAPIFKYGLIRERMAALITDALRAGLLEEVGYQVQILEFIDMEHTPKNLLIRAVKTGKPKDMKSTVQLMKELHINPTLERLLYREGEVQSES